MSGVNKVIMVGYAAADPEMRYTANGKAVTTFRLGVSERQGETEWVSCVVWEKLAETASQYITKGKQVYIEGRLATRSWDGPDGAKRYRTEVICNNVTFLGARGEGVPAGVAEDTEPDDLPFDS